MPEGKVDHKRRVCKSRNQKPSEKVGKKWGASVARRPPGRVSYLTTNFRKRRLGSHRNFTSVNVIVGTCRNDPITAVSCRAKALSLLRASILFRPRLASRRTRSRVEAPGTAPGSAAPIPQSVYHHSRQADPIYIARNRPEKRGLRGHDGNCVGIQFTIVISARRGSHCFASNYRRRLWRAARWAVCVPFVGRDEVVLSADGLAAAAFSNDSL